MSALLKARTTMPHAVRLVDYRGEVHWVCPLDPTLRVKSERFGHEAVGSEVTDSTGTVCFLSEPPDIVARLLWPLVEDE
jgi:hypothetical protein